MTALHSPSTTDRYAQQVRDACSDLPPSARDELLEDLDEHLADVAADLTEGETLADRLGRAEDYAADLRQSAGYPPATPDRRARRAFGQGRLATRARSLWDESDQHPQGRAVRQYLTDLRPAWWLARAYLVATGLAEVTASGDGLNVIPHVFGSSAIGLVLVIALGWLSIRLGRSTQPDQHPDRRRRRGAAWFSAVAVACLLLALAQYDDVRTVYESDTMTDQADAPGFLTSSDGDPIKNIYAFSADGKPLDGVLLYDDQGRPIDAVTVWDDDGNEMTPRFPTTDDGTEVRNQYPTEFDVTAVDGSDIAPPRRPNLAVPVLGGASTPTTKPKPTTTTEPPTTSAAPTTTAPSTTTTARSGG